jgi:hypothetical protein
MAIRNHFRPLGRNRATSGDGNRDAENLQSIGVEDHGAAFDLALRTLNT